MWNLTELLYDLFDEDHTAERAVIMELYIALMRNLQIF